MTRKFLATMLAMLFLAGPVYGVAAQTDDPIPPSLDYLIAQQQPDGGFTNGFTEGSDLGTTNDAILALAAAGRDPAGVTSADGLSPLDYVAAQIEGGSLELLGARAKTALVLLSTGQDPATFAGYDLLADLEAAYDEAGGSYGSSVFDQALVILTLSAAGQPVPEGAVDDLLDNRTDDGAWALFGETEPDAADTNTTAMAIQALLITGHEEETEAAFEYLHGVQNEDGGFPYQSPSEYGTDTDANSTAYVLQAILAAGEPLDDWAPAGTDPRQALLNLYDEDSGAFLWQAAVGAPNVLATAQAIPPLEGYTYVDPPQIAAGYTPQAAADETTSEEGGADDELLPESGAEVYLPPALILAGLALVGVGVFLRRRSK